MGHENDLYFSAFRWCRREKHLKHCIREKFCSRFLIQKVLCKVRVCSEYCAMSRTKRRNAYKQVSEFNRGRMLPVERVFVLLYRLSHWLTTIHYHVNMVPRDSIGALACTVSRSVTHWKHLVMSCWETAALPLSS